jgi:malonate-semialdehyde dehydrogenase (acetylating)/methylmalonate-semialdehyde dehydrogenase
MSASTESATTSPAATDGTKTLHHVINGKAVSGSPGATAEVFNPATGQVTATVPMADAATTKLAIEAAASAFPGWAETPPLRRARILFRFRDLIEKNADKLASVISSEHGKLHDDALGEVTRGLEVVEFACGIPHLLKGEFSESVGTSVDSWSMRQPVGVCAGITPFNFPVMVPMWMLPIALACGNTFVLKPSEKDPSASLLIADLLAEAGLPPGVFNVVNGGREAVDTLLNDPRVDAVSFVGSTPVAEYIYNTGCSNGKKVQALGGAKNHAVIMPDADMEMAAKALMGAAYGSAGERCMAISVAVAVGDAGDRLVDTLAPMLRKLRVGPSTDESAEMGPLVTGEHLEKVRSYVDLGVAEGAKLVVDGRELKVEGHSGGFFLGGCVFDHVQPSMRVYKEEIFGPVLVVLRVNDLEEALHLVNSHEFGNGTAIFTGDGRAARQFTHDVQAGMVGINVPIPVPMAFHSFGGWKRSLFGALHVHGPDGVRFYTRLKTVTARWPDQTPSDAQYTMPTM